MIRVFILSVLLLVLSSCSLSRSVAVQQCPAIKPIGLSLNKDWRFDRGLFPISPKPIELLQSRYQESLGLLEEADGVISQYRARNRVWEESWKSCGKNK